MTLRDSFYRAINEYDMFSAGDRVLIAFSGGADSVCLTDLLLKEKAQLNIEVEAAHVNHGIRGTEADADEAFVRAFCASRGVKLHVLHADVPSLSAAAGESEELCARRVRYEYFASLGFDKIATAHTGSDSVETMLMHLTRGSALHGLTGIPPVRTNIVRPLIFLTRDQIETYCKENRLSYVTDSTNLRDDYDRNRFRHHVVPALTSIRPSFEASALRCIDSLRRDDDYLSGRAKEIMCSVLDPEDDSLRLSHLAQLHPSLCYRVIGAYLSYCGCVEYEDRHLAGFVANLNAASYSLVIPGGVKFTIRDGRLFRENVGLSSPSDPFAETKVDKHSGGEFRFGKFLLHITVADMDSFEEKSADAVDFSSIDDIMVLRTRRAGDKLSIGRRRCTKSLKKLFSEEKIPLSDREKIPVLSDGRGVIWTAGFGVDASRQPGSDTKKILIIKMESGNNDE